MKLDKINTVYFLGIGGIGMSALARFFMLQGKQVYGYDLTSTEITSQLIAEGAHIQFDEDVSKIPPQVDVVIYTPAVPKEHAAYQYFIANKTPLLKRSEILGIICNDYPTIAVAGTHGKTTTTAMITQLLAQKGERRKEKGEKSPSNFEGVSDEVGRGSLYENKILSFIGGIAKNFNSNLVCEPDFDTVIVEADEFDRSFLTLHPQVAIITSIDADHLDVYGAHEHLKTSFQLFANQIQPNGTLVIYDEIADEIEHSYKVRYGFSDKAEYRISNIQYYPAKTTFDLIYKPPRPAAPDTPSKFEGDILPHTTYRIPFILNISGKHNVLNAVAAIAACIEFSLWKDKNADISHLLEIFIEKLTEFSGVRRRFDIRIQHDDLVYIDDYAHHPEEIKAFLDAVKKSYPTKKITGIFQPHLYSRTRDFVHEFAEALEVLDEIILLDIYPAREKPIEGITSGYLLSLIKNENKKLLKKEELVSYFQSNKPEVLLTMGAGDIDKLVPVLESSLLLAFSHLFYEHQ
ncbi:MAG: UDP-N-acetylmuramate--L-alanine ligase [Bacteroidetes bacterium]|nr:UDP-N-acetylmuramate--L-alanine ligase [Bacteroidota bacterium]MCL2302016.1 UDP-N-acetylmuramate--L-alanine ligase [Lentimicrobiaceae bacterium]